ITVLGCPPSYALFLAEQAQKKGIDLAKETKIRITWHTGEPGASIPATKAKIEAAFSAKAFDLPGLTEIAAWGFECDARSGLTHVHEDYCYPEVLDEDDRPVKPGEKGELVFTSLYRKAMPLIRYRTRDLVQLADRPCPCGRTLVAFEGGVLARLDDMKKIRGVIVYPRRVEELVRPHADVDEFQIVFRRHDGLDDILIRIDPSPALSLIAREGVRAQPRGHPAARRALSAAGGAAPRQRVRGDRHDRGPRRRREGLGARPARDHLSRLRVRQLRVLPARRADRVRPLRLSRRPQGRRLRRARAGAGREPPAAPRGDRLRGGRRGAAGPAHLVARAGGPGRGEAGPGRAR